jgi:uncharacterized cupin superfamily protein
MRALLVQLCLAAISPLAAFAAATPVHRMPDRSFVVHAADVVAQATPSGERADYFDAPTATLARFEVHRTTLQPGKRAHAAHRHEREELTILLEGELEVTSGETTKRVGPGSVLFAASNDLHGLLNAGTTPTTYLVINFYTTPPATPLPAGKTAQPSAVWEWKDVPVKTSPATERRDFFNSPTRTMPKFDLHVTRLHDGAPQHGGKHADEQFFVMKDGEMDAVAGGETVRVRAGDLFFAASGQEFGWHHTGGAAATYYVVRFTTPATPTAPAAERH